MSDLGQLEGMSVVLEHLDAYVEGLHASALAAAEEIGDLLANYAKSHHAWKPRTGATDASTTSAVIDGNDVIDIYLAAGMDYDVFLELARDGKWAWLFPAIEANKERIMQILVARLGNARVQ
jgi:hypothetical protein